MAIRVYEDYGRPWRRRAVLGAKRGHPTGTTGYLMIDDDLRDGARYEGRAPVFDGARHDDPHPQVNTTGISQEYLRTCCRRVAASRIPKPWREALGLEGEEG